MPSRKRHRKQQPAQMRWEPETAWIVEDPPTIRLLVDAIFDPTRYKPMILVTTPTDTRRPRVCLDELAEAVGEAADIAVLSRPEMAWELSNLLPQQLLTYGGAVRVWWPYASPDDPSDRHPSFVTMQEEHGPRTIRGIRHELVRHGYLDETPRTPAPDGPEKAPTPPPWQDRDKDANLRTSESSPQDLEAELTRATERVSRLSTENSELKRSLRGANDRIEELERRLYQRSVFADPARQLRHEIETAWLLGYTEPDRERYPMRPYTFGPEFISSVENLEGIERERIVDACVDVITRRAYEVNSLAARKYRSNIAGNATQRVREDGATAWRANLQTATPAARRLAWWERPDQSVELARAAMHDDHRELR